VLKLQVTTEMSDGIKLASRERHPRDFQYVDIGFGVGCVCVLRLGSTLVAMVILRMTSGCP